MTSAWAGHDGFVHEAAIYDSDDELLHVVVPHLEAGLDAGLPTFAALQDHEAVLVRAALRRSTSVGFLPGFRGQRPPATIQWLTSLLRGLAAAGAEQIRLVSTVPHPGLGVPWDDWSRYEAAVNELLGDLPVWGICLYDRRVTPPDVLVDVECTHPRIAANGGHLLNDRYQDPRSFILSRNAPRDPLEAEPPAIELVDPTPAASRHAVQDTARRTLLHPDDVEILVLATSEAVTNAMVHGRPPVTVRVWTAMKRTVVTVHDRGTGPQDPYVGLVPRRSALDGGGGFGLWLAHQLLPVAYSRDDGFTVRLTAGAPLPQ